MCAMNTKTEPIMRTGNILFNLIIAGLLDSPPAPDRDRLKASAVRARETGHRQFGV